MVIKVLVVDDSSFFQARLKEMIGEHPELEVIGVASNGRDAIDMAQRLKPDIITMDYEMPVLDGVSAVRAIMSQRPVPILMFSSLTYEGARVTLDALEAGAVDFIPKNFAEISRDSVQLKGKLHERLLTLSKGRQAPPLAQTSAAARPLPRQPQSGRSLKGRTRVLIIGASTGGPVALTDVLTQLPADFSVPILLVQHMPENFTKAFAERLHRQCAIDVREACSGDRLRPGLALLAPGGRQLILDQHGKGTVKVLPGDTRINYKPSLDITFASAANAYGDRVLGVVLTGMGADGCEGARLLKERGAVIWSQDEASSVIYGMPMAVAKARLTDQVLSLKNIGPELVKAL